jgi:hypothetical protein
MKSLFLLLLSTIAATAALSEKELESIGHRVWQNECGGTREGLTSWNQGENFASLGIGHFIWYPKGVDGPFDESFPKLVHFFAANGVKLPAWLAPDARCPWATRADFEAARHGDHLEELRTLLASTVPLQSRFLADRLAQALPKMLAAAPEAERDPIRRQFERLSASGPGTFALIDYVNFKGEGTNPTERYHGEGWGLLQVLSGMHGSGPGAAAEFGSSAAEVLTRRVRNSPPERHEDRWLAGWKNRVRAYAG